jgi:hypothetical protein
MNRGISLDARRRWGRSLRQCGVPFVHPSPTRGFRRTPSARVMGSISARGALAGRCRTREANRRRRDKEDPRVRGTGSTRAPTPMASTTATAATRQDPARTSLRRSASVAHRVPSDAVGSCGSGAKALVKLVTSAIHRFATKLACSGCSCKRRRQAQSANSIVLGPVRAQRLPTVRALASRAHAPARRGDERARPRARRRGPRAPRRNEMRRFLHRLLEAGGV